MANVSCDQIISILYKENRVFSIQLNNQTLITHLRV